MRTTFTALEIGSGDAFLLEDDDRTILFDSGGSKSRIEDLLKNKGITKIDLAICSHNDGDHANGFIGLLNAEKIGIDEIWLPYWWSSILQYADEHGINWDEVERISSEINDKSIKDHNPESLFSEEHEPLSDEAFDRVLSRLSERMNHEDKAPKTYSTFYGFMHDISYDMICRLVHDTKHDLHFDLDSEVAHQLARDIARRVTDYVANDVAHYVAYDVADYVADYVANDVADDVANYVANYVARYVANYVGCHKKDTYRYVQKYLSARIRIDNYLQSNSFNHHETANSVNNIRIMFDNIMEIARLAYQHGCKIKWFEPTKSCTNNPIPNTNFIALNSNQKRQVKKLKNTVALAYALYLTVENEYSLAFEYLKDDTPIIRFSADSDSVGGSLPYNSSIIITAPHHGSEANADVYGTIDPVNQDNIIWVRSDALNKTQGRPCGDFKLRSNRYCLACKHRIKNKKREVCFEYINNQWNPDPDIEQCQCK